MALLTASQVVKMLHQDIISCMHRTIDLLASNFKSLCFEHSLDASNFWTSEVRAVISEQFRGTAAARVLVLEFQRDVHPAQSNVACENR